MTSSERRSPPIGLGPRARPPRAAARVALLWMGASVGLPLVWAWAQGARGAPPPESAPRSAPR